MAASRLSLGTPYRLSAHQQKIMIEAAEKDPALLAKMATLLDVTADEWKLKPAQDKLLDLQKFEEMGAIKATIAKAAEAGRRFDSETTGVNVTNDQRVDKLIERMTDLENKVEHLRKQLEEANIVIDTVLGKSKSSKTNGGTK